MSADERRFAPAASRNREPILEVMQRFVRPRSRVLEIASGTGEHAIFLAPRLDVESWQPSDPSADARTSIDAWRAHENEPRILPALRLDVTAPWPELSANVVVCINMIHIAPWQACLGLLDGASKVLPPQGLLYLYGPYRREGRHTAPSNEAFDARLRSDNPDWGVRDLEDVVAAANARGLSLVEVVPMPANNFSVLLSSGA
jgi:hypothetical protein